jgi:hypothetical protein
MNDSQWIHLDGATNGSADENEVRKIWATFNSCFRSVSRTWGIIVWINKEIQECLWQDNCVLLIWGEEKQNSVQKITAREKKRINQVGMTSEKNHYWVRVWTHNNMHLRSRTEWNKNCKIFIIHCVMCTYFMTK